MADLSWRTAREARMSMVEAAQSVTSLKRLGECGRRQVNGLSPVGVMLRGDEGRAGFSNVRFCGSVWSCPACSGVIRATRGLEVTTITDAHSVGTQDRVGEGSALLVTATVPHVSQDKLADSLKIVLESWRALWSGKQAGITRDLMGYAGACRALEVTHGGNGWHPHLHALILLDAPLTPDRVASVHARLSAAWAKQCARRGWGAPSPMYGLRVDPVRRGLDAVGAYVAKLQDGQVIGRSGVGWEIARMDRKTGRVGGVTPFEMLSRLLLLDGRPGPAAARERGVITDLWQEYEAAFRGRSAVRWTQGRGPDRAPTFALENKVILDDVGHRDDAQVVADVLAARGGSVVAKIEPNTWAALCRTPGARARVLALAEDAGVDAGRKIGALAAAILEAEMADLADFWERREPEPTWFSMAETTALAFC